MSCFIFFFLGKLVVVDEEIIFYSIFRHTLQGGAGWRDRKNLPLAIPCQGGENPQDGAVLVGSGVRTEWGHFAIPTSFISVTASMIVSY